MRCMESADEIVTSITSSDMNAKLPALNNNAQANNNLDFYNQNKNTGMKQGVQGRVSQSNLNTQVVSINQSLQ